MDIKLIIILALVALSYYQYTYPEASHTRLEPLWGKVTESMGSWNNQEPPEDDDVCPETINPVCGSDGVTYDNICKAALADILEVTNGECQ